MCCAASQMLDTPSVWLSGGDRKVPMGAGELGGFCSSIKPGDLIEKGHTATKHNSPGPGALGVLAAPFGAVVIEMTTLPAISRRTGL